MNEDFISWLKSAQNLADFEFPNNDLYYDNNIKKQHGGLSEGINKFGINNIGIENKKNVNYQQLNIDSTSKISYFNNDKRQSEKNISYNICKNNYSLLPSNSDNENIYEVKHKINRPKKMNIGIGNEFNTKGYIENSNDIETIKSTQLNYDLQYKELLDSNAKMRAECHDLIKLNHELTTQLTIEKESVRALQEKEAKHTEHINDLRNKVTTLENAVTTLTNELSTSKTELNNVYASLKCLNNTHEEQRKKLINEYDQQINNIRTQHKEEYKNLEKEYNEEINRLKKEIHELNNNSVPAENSQKWANMKYMNDILKLDLANKYKMLDNILVKLDKLEKDYNEHTNEQIAEIKEQHNKIIQKKVNEIEEKNSIIAAFKSKVATSNAEKDLINEKLVNEINRSKALEGEVEKLRQHLKNYLESMLNEIIQ